jgi:DNA repair exonuclease SbcCD ATPase subunit
VKKVIFNSVKIQNFLSVGKEPIEISFQKGITLITGENKDKGGKNGIGKSTINDAIYWCLFGNTIRELKKDKIIHNRSKSDCKVELNFLVESQNELKNYTLIRHLDPAKISFVCNDEDITLSTIPNTDELIKQTIGANEDVFQNVVIMSTNSTIPFMAQKKIDKRKFIEGILQLNIFSEMLSKIRTHFNDTKKENDIKCANFINEQKILKILKDNRDNFNESKQFRIETVKTKIELNKKQIEELKDEDVADTTTLKKELDDFREKENKLNKLQAEVNQQITELSSTRKEYEMIVKQKDFEKNNLVKKGSKCPTCNRSYCVDDIDHVTKKIELLNEQIKKENTSLWDTEQKIKEKKELISKIFKNKIKIQNLIDENIATMRKSSLHEEKITNLLNKNKDWEKDIENINNETFKDDKKILNIENSIETLQTELEKIKIDLKVLETSKLIVSEDGVKTFIVKKIINVLNNRLNYYLNRLDAPCKCIFDETFEETMLNEHGQECSYHNFSNGEKRRIDIAILFTFQDVLRLHSGNCFSFSFFDETLDGCLDKKGTDKIIEILRERVESYGESIYVISHKSDTTTQIENVLMLEKKDGATKIVNSI